MLAKVSTFLGPNGFFTTGGTPSLVLSLDAAGYTVSGTWSDLSTFHNDATSNGPISWSSEGGGSFDFNGSSAYFGFSTVSGIPLGNSPYTMEAWFKSDSYGSGCNLTLEVSSSNVTTWMDDINGGTGYYLSVGIWDGSAWTYVHSMSITGTLTYQDVIDFFNPLPDLSCSFNVDTNQLDFIWNKFLICGETYVLKIAVTDGSLDIIQPLQEGDSINCACTAQGSLVSWGSLFTQSYSNVLRLNDNGILNYWWDNDIYADFSGSQSLYLDNWYYVASTYDGTNRKIYLNGLEVVTATVSTPPSVDDMTTLKIGYDGLNYFSGKISKVKVHTKALSSAKILSNFDADKVRHGVIFGSMTFSSGDKSYLISSSDDYLFGTNDFTIEAFVNLQLSTELYGGIVSLRPNGESYISINTVLANTSSPLIEFFAGGVYYNFTASNDMWYHTAISRVSGTTSFYVNGALFTEITDSNTYNASNDVVVGRYYTDSDDYYTQGLISNVRIVNGTGLYSGPSITIPDTPLQPITNTKLLIISQQTSPTLDVSGNFQSTTASNIGWTSSLPSFAPPYTTEGLELYVDAGVSESYPGSGTTLFDLSPNGFNMNIGTGSTWSSDPSGGVLYFDGSYSGQIDLDGPVSSNIVSVTHSTGYTMEVMVNFDSVSSSQGIFTFCGNVWGSSGYIDLQLENSTLRWEVAQGYNRTSGTFSSSTWYNITATYDGTSLLEIFVNGALIGTHTVLGTSPHTSTSAKFVLGMWDGPLVGKIGFARFYSRELTSEEVLSNFENSKVRFGL